jgi:transcriptional regulator with XRE-family HTH domain
MPLRRYRLAQRRKTVGLSQERLAEIVGVDRSTVVRWERADTDPQPWHRPGLATTLKLSLEELAELLADKGEPPARPNERLDYALKNPARVDLDAVAYLRERVRRLDEQYDRLPSILLLAEAGQLHGQTLFLREHAGSGRVQRELTVAATESATLMGQLDWDASQRRDHATAVSYLDQAIVGARQTRDLVAQANAGRPGRRPVLPQPAQPTGRVLLAVPRQAPQGRDDPRGDPADPSGTPEVNRYRPRQPRAGEHPPTQPREGGSPPP